MPRGEPKEKITMLHGMSSDWKSPCPYEEGMPAPPIYLSNGKSIDVYWANGATCGKSNDGELSHAEQGEYQLRLFQQPWFIGRQTGARRGGAFQAQMGTK